jgi:hypothetical protein
MIKNKLKYLMLISSFALSENIYGAEQDERKALANDHDLIAHDSTYASFEELRQKALAHTIEFHHGVSEFTLSKINEETKSFFMMQGGLIDGEGQPGPNIQIIDNFAIDMASSLARSRSGPIRFGQNIKTREFVACKPFRRSYQPDKIPDVHFSSALGTYRGILDHPESDRQYLALELVDGIDFFSLYLMVPKINHHARFLIAYNLIRSLEDLSLKHIVQRDDRPDNLMVSASNFDVKIIDYGSMSQQVDGLRVWYSLTPLTLIFTDELGEELGEHREKYQHGTFKDFWEFIENVSENGNMATLYSLIQKLPRLEQPLVEKG